MITLGLLMTLASIPGYTSVTIPGGWAVMSIILPWFQWRPYRFGPLHWLFVAFLAYAAGSLLWTTAPWEGAFRLWQLVLIFFAFCLGSALIDLRLLVKGLGIGCAINSAFAIAQHFGFQPVLFYSISDASGLFYNPMWLGGVLSLVAVACYSHGYVLLGTLAAPGVYLSHSRGGAIAFCLGVIFIFWRSNRLLTLSILSGILAVTLSDSIHEAERLLIWKSTLLNLTPFGWGSGSFTDLYLILNGAIRHPESTHNDLLQLVFEFGIGTGPILFLAIACLQRTHTDEWPVLATFIFLSFFTFPLFYPITALLGALCAGRIAADLSVSWPRLPIRRCDFLSWNSLRSTQASPPCSESLPVLQRT